jgi:exopolysaccharide biosynthesis polyprenyl glycosylphosphotransferase
MMSRGVIPRRIFMLIDAGMVTAAFVVAHLVLPVLWPLREHLVRLTPLLSAYLRPAPAYAPWPLAEQLWVLLVFTPVVLLGLVAVNAYNERGLSRTRMILTAPLATAVALSFVTLIIFLLKSEAWSRLFVFAFSALTVTALTGVRTFIHRYGRWRTQAGYNTRHVLLVTPSRIVTTVVEFLRKYWGDGFIVVGYLSESVDARGSRLVPLHVFAGSNDLRSDGSVGLDSKREVINAPAWLGNVSEIESVLQKFPVQEVVTIADDLADGAESVLRACDHVGVPVRVVPSSVLSLELANLVAGSDGQSGARIPSILFRPRVWDEETLYVKRVIDLLFSAAGIILLSPVFAVVALLVRISGPGPVLHRYYMVGQNGRQFLGQKFRTMIPNAHALKASLLDHNEMTGPVFKMRNDPRVTKIGRWLRKFSLDELPQLYSVLKGDMSLIGPRPAGPDEYERFEFWHMRKVSVRPGITCLWQVRGRNAISSFDEWVKLDLEYIDNWSLWLDFKILVRTVFVVLRATGL